MSKQPQGNHVARNGQHAHYRLRLFIAGGGQNSQKAIANLRTLCDEHLKDQCTIETIDVVTDFQAAVRDNILVTPALLLVAPRPRTMILGTLSDAQTVLVALRLSGGRS